MDRLKSVQGEDVYLGIYTGDQRLGANGVNYNNVSSNWDVWGHYHILYGLISWHRITGNETALAMAVKAADYLYDSFTGQGKLYTSAGECDKNLAISHAFAELYKETGKTKYLEAAQSIVDVEWHMAGAGDWIDFMETGD